MKYKVSVQIAGDLNFDPVKATFGQLTNAMKEILTEGKDVAIKTYLKKRISDRPGSFVVASFIEPKLTYNVGESIVGVIQCGGAQAPYAPYLEYDRRLVNGKLWSSVNSNAPYAFMEAGAKHMENVGLDIIKKHLKK